MWISGRTVTEKLCDRETELAFCKEHPGSTGQRNCIQHYGNSDAERAETLQLPHLCDGADEKSWPVPGEGSHVGTASLVHQPAG